MMGNSRKLKLCLALVAIVIFIGACGMKEEEQIKETFNKTLSLYPT
ncbi:tandem-type lipoprotein, partial [Staphylococcus argenteus]|nr:tandem-type lipoprotein [Staphylococcus argenteus]